MLTRLINRLMYEFGFVLVELASRADDLLAWRHADTTSCVSSRCHTPGVVSNEPPQRREMERAEMTFDLWNGHATTLDIDEPGWLLAGRLTDVDTGESWKFTYLSRWVQPGDAKYEQMLDFVDGALSIGEPETITDPEMMFGQAILTLHELRPLDVTA